MSFGGCCDGREDPTWDFCEVAVFSNEDAVPLSDKGG